MKPVNWTLANSKGRWTSRRRASATLRAMKHLLTLLIAVCFSSGVSVVLAGTPLVTQLVDRPFEEVGAVPPVVMLTMSRDHQYFFRAYDDYSDLNREDGLNTLETTYTDAIEYYGYFHPRKCYAYQNSRFEKIGNTGADRAGAGTHYCHATRGWSGNFLNWATMTRMDIVRKTLYGGFRHVDTATETVLERAALPTDAHAFAKYYSKPDVVDLIPAAYESSIIVGDDPDIPGPDPDIAGLNEGITLCNVTRPTTEAFAFGQAMPERPTRPPLLRVVRGNHQLWAANEGRQCTWRENGAEAGIQSNGNTANADGTRPSGIYARTTDPINSRALRTNGTTGVDAVDIADDTRDHIVRVLVCETAPLDAASNFENCRAYGNNFKPEGLLQRYGTGTGERIRFGLMTGSYTKNKSGGILRKAVGGMDDEIEATTGVFRTPPSSTTPGIIRTLNALQIYGYDYSVTFPYRVPGDTTLALTRKACGFSLSFTEGDCGSWGNPISEIYQESLRYLALKDNRAPSANFRSAGDPEAGRIAGLNEDPNWAGDPLGGGTQCASNNIVVVNSSINSFEDDGQTASVKLNTAIDGKALTDAVGDAEGISGRSFFIGRANDASASTLCTGKTVAKFGDALGICPEGPTLAGSYHIAGLAAHAHTQDLRTTDDFPGQQRIDTYALSLSTNSPVITIPVGAQTVTLIPAYRLVTDDDAKTEAEMTRQGSGALVDFRVVFPPTEVAPASGLNAEAGTAAQPGSRYTKAVFYANWEDREQGGDYDQDVWGVIEYRLDQRGGTPTLEIRTNTLQESTQGKQLFGFVINGTTQDGFHAFSGVRGANFTDPLSGIKGCANCRARSENADGLKGYRSHVFTVGSSSTTTELLKPPLFYAAKWGGFSDLNGNKKPDLRTEWDTRDANGDFVEGGDGIPDNYFVITNPGAMESALSRVFNAILARVSSGTAAAVSTSGRTGTGLLAQASYESVRRDTVDPPSEVTWLGNITGLWVDKQGFLREEGGVGADGSVSLGGYRSDPRVDIFFDETARRTRVRRYLATTEDSLDGADLFIDELSSLSPVWDARRELSRLPGTALTANRAYDGTPASAGRYLFTWLDDDADGIVDAATGGSAAEQIAFETGTFTGTRAEWLTPPPNLSVAQRSAWVNSTVNWIRGQELSGLRSRLIDLDNDGLKEVARIGDILHSSPEVVAAPNEGYGNVLSESTAVKALAGSYQSFRDRYRNRRHVVYVGANDGTLHAFNAGFFDDSSAAYRLTPAAGGSGTELAHPLGAELWAYVPKNVLPHLKFLTDPAYAHLYYVDGSPQAYDLKIFPDDGPTGTHPGGWGTVLMVTLGFGGGADEFPTTVDVQGDANPANDVKTRSAIVLLDVTNPEEPPRLLAELTPDNLHYTLSAPHPVLVRNGTNEAWFLIAGSGPSNRAAANYISSATGRAAELMVFDLTQIVAGNPAAHSPTRLSVGNDVFVGDLVAGDFDFDLNTDAVYFGTVGRVDGEGGPALGGDGNPLNQGNLYRLNLNKSRDPTAWGEQTGGALPLMSGVSLPFAKAPTLGLDGAGNRWVIAASGRYEARPDRATGSRQRQALVGIIDPPRSTSIPFADPILTGSSTSQGLLDVTRALVFSDGSIDVDGVDATGAITPTFSHLSLRAAVQTAGGWKRWFAKPTGTGTQLAERGVSGILSIGTTLLLPAFTPDTAACVTEGKSTLLGLALETGVPPERGVFRTVPCPQCLPAQALAELVPPSPPAEGQTLANPANFTAIQYEGRLEASSLVGQVGGLRSGASADGGFSARLCAQSSTASLQCENIRLKDRITSQEISWRQRRR